MGGAPSRRLTVEADDDTIHLTDGMLDRLQSRLDRKRQRPADAEAGADAAPSTGDHAAGGGGGSGGGSRGYEPTWLGAEHDTMIEQTLLHAFNEGLALGHLEERHAMEKELHDLDLAWQTKLDSANQKRESAVTEEFNQLLAKFQTGFTMAKKEPQCQERQAAVLQCYRDHPSRTLNCNDLVRDFMKCAENARLAYLVSGGSKGSP